jgi:hypothetical protein
VILFTIWLTGWQLALHFPWVSNTILNNLPKKNQNIPRNRMFFNCEIFQSSVFIFVVQDYWAFSRWLHSQKVIMALGCFIALEEEKIKAIEISVGDLKKCTSLA